MGGGGRGGGGGGGLDEGRRRRNHVIPFKSNGNGKPFAIVERNSQFNLVVHSAKKLDFYLFLSIYIDQIISLITLINIHQRQQEERIGNYQMTSFQCLTQINHHLFFKRINFEIVKLLENFHNT